MSADPANVRAAIVLQGGGALGADELGVLKALYDQRPGSKSAAVAGISIGAITAAVLGGARGEPIAALERLWRDKLTVHPSVPRLPGYDNPVHAPRDREIPGGLWQPWHVRPAPAAAGRIEAGYDDAKRQGVASP